MSFLDNLENTLKSAESRDERDMTNRRNQKQADAERSRAKSVQPVAEELRNSKFTSDLLTEVTRISHGLRTKVYITWIGATLRLEAREHRMEFTPTADGVVATTYSGAKQTGTQQIDLKKSPKPIAEKWLAAVGPRPEPKPTDIE
jgi:desulfoferrodoxin (superoxide reductase-like protein)